MRGIVLVVLTGFFFSMASAALASGLADPLESVEEEWQGHLHVKRGSLFGNPERVGNFALETKGLFGAEEGEAPSKAQFFRGIRKLLPKRFKFVAGYRRHSSEEVYTFRSNTLKSIPGIRDASAYSNEKRDRNRLGTFTLVVKHDSDDQNHIPTCTLHLGLPDDFAGDKSILFNPFINATGGSS